YTRARYWAAKYLFDGDTTRALALTEQGVVDVLYDRGEEYAQQLLGTISRLEDLRKEVKQNVFKPEFAWFVLLGYCVVFRVQVADLGSILSFIWQIIGGGILVLASRELWEFSELCIQRDMSGRESHG
ncbi:MAG: hypothetical protein ABH845_05730, partial [Candidatus Omnitrophota bacterium]